MTTLAERTYSTVDKAAWGDGPWQDEPDKVQWTDEATGLPCLAVRNSLGAWCGYVGVSEGHPWFRRDYGDGEWDSPDRPDGVIDVHGGLTYSEACQEGSEEEAICHIPEPGQPDNVWWFGFDCAHSGDVVPGMEARERERGHTPIRFDGEAYRDLAYVRREVAALAAQLEARAAA